MPADRELAKEIKALSEQVRLLGTSLEGMSKPPDASSGVETTAQTDTGHAAPSDPVRDSGYEKWLQIQYGMAHHDIWWVKGQQIKAGNWTLLLLAALVSVGQLMTPKDRSLDPGVGYLLAVFSLLVTVLGSLYVWSLYATLVASRGRAKKIVNPLTDPEGIFTDAKREPQRHTVFPWAITLLLSTGLGFVTFHFGVPLCLTVMIPVVCFIVTPKLGEVLEKWSD